MFRRTCLFVILASSYCPAQSDQSPHFEVASIRPVDRTVQMHYSEDAGLISYTRIPLANLICDAYNVYLDQITGPDLLNTEFFAISAKLPAGATKEQVPQMMANLLAERFGLVAHRIAKDVTGYELAIAPGGPKHLTPASSVPDAPPDASFERPKPAADGYPPLGAGFTSASNFDNGMMKTTFRVSMASLARWVRMTLFQSALGETVPVEDHTGLSGTFDFRLEIPQPAMRLPPALRQLTGQTITRDGDPGIGPRDIAAALEKQLGLKLTPVKAKLDFVVVDHVNKVPTEN